MKANSVEQRHAVLGEILFLLSQQERSLRECGADRADGGYASRARRIDNLLRSVCSPRPGRHSSSGMVENRLDD